MSDATPPGSGPPARPGFPVPSGFPGYAPAGAPPSPFPPPPWASPQTQPPGGPVPTPGTPWPVPWSAPPPAYPPMQPGPVGRTPSGLFPARTSRPTYREPHPAAASAIMTGVAAGALWMLLFGLIGRDAQSYCWWSIGAALVAWACSAFLARAGDRGIAIGVAISSSVGLAIAATVVIMHWVGGNWLLW